MSETKKSLHIIAFDVPWPADYGGVIDVFYKIRALYKAGVDVILHCYQYGREEAAILRELCREVYYYPRETGIRSQLSRLPYIVRSRNSESLVQRLLEDDYPILTEGLHSTMILNDRRFNGRKILCRTANVEHDYYKHLSAGERNMLRKSFFSCEAFKLRWYEDALAGAEKILAISPNDEKYFAGRFGASKVRGVYAFHQYEEVVSVPGRGDFFLYHGKLDVAENNKAVMDMLPVFENWKGLPLVVAGMNPPKFLVAAIENYPSVKLIANPTSSEMQKLIGDAHAHLLVTSQPTGLKLKLLAALFKGRFVIVNDMMVAGTGLERLCRIGNTTEELRRVVENVEHQVFTKDEAMKRREALRQRFSNDLNAQKIIELL